MAVLYVISSTPNDQPAVKLNVIGDDAVNLFGHTTVEAPQSGFHMRYWNMQLHRGESAHNRRVRVPIDNNHVRPRIKKNLFNFIQHLPSLASMTARSDAKIESRTGNCEFLEKDVRHTSSPYAPVAKKV
jgi:hypothetical protein